MLASLIRMTSKCVHVWKGLQSCSRVLFGTVWRALGWHTVPSRWHWGACWAVRVACGETCHMYCLSQRSRAFLTCAWWQISDFSADNFDTTRQTIRLEKFVPTKLDSRNQNITRMPKYRKRRIINILEKQSQNMTWELSKIVNCHINF